MCIHIGPQEIQTMMATKIVQQQFDGQISIGMMISAMHIIISYVKRM
ncbi:hypothetical protein KUTeg_009496 [Tegillarca granosa]|uniref:Uncharacterized protein n=1 Tax=Tegillarca granosa TaxID=220873 RepID=A0ABQ9F419_TEGGR|nr:hypothetical protein KUTeg_009496 [Tegillarca granosa]